MTSKSLMKVLACTVVALGAVSLAQAQPKAVDPSGTWTWTGGGRGGGGGGGGGGGARGGGGTNTLVLKYEAGKLTGTLQAPARGPRRGANADATTPAPAPTPPPKVEIKDGKVDGDTVSFSVTSSRGGNDITTLYKGKVTADKITGTRTVGDNDPVDWVATKQAPKV
ncbi:MAG: hypothetical protein ABSG78_22710 [Verrucomicrobiota bacterium]